MPSDTLSIENFKGIKEKQEFSIRPLTIFCGPNSSGKSTCIHALAALAQTTKLTASHLPIVLDDEYAQVHLGRFLDVIHSKSIKDSFSIGLSIANPTSVIVRSPTAPKKPPRVHADFSFRAKSTTQEIYLQSTRMTLKDTTYLFKKKNSATNELSNARRKAAAVCGHFHGALRPPDTHGAQTSQATHRGGNVRLFLDGKR